MMHGSGDFPILSANESQSETLVLVPGSSVTSHYRRKNTRYGSNISKSQQHAFNY